MTTTMTTTPATGCGVTLRPESEGGARLDGILGGRRQRRLGLDAASAAGWVVVGVNASGMAKHTARESYFARLYGVRVRG